MREHTPLIDVIVPVYNGERYMKACVDSLLNQDFSDFVITLVDDGSTDGTGPLCDAYAREHPGRVRVIHQQNAGPSAARNTAAARSEAAWLTFVDSDDHVAENYLSALYGAAREFDAPMAVSPLCREYARPDGSVQHTVPPVMPRGALDRETALREILFEEYFGCYVGGRLVRRDIAAATPLPPGQIFEDSFAIWRQVAACDKVAYIPDAVYFYVQRQGSLLHRRFEPQHLDLIATVKDMMDGLRARNMPAAVLAAGAQKVCRGCYVTAYHGADLPLGQFRQVCAELLPLLRENFPAACSTGRLAPRARLMCRLLMTSPALFFAVVRLYTIFSP